LQVAYPETFGGCWSLAPDPVDFRSFQLTNIYDPDDNLYYEPDGSPRAVARGRDRAMKPFVDAEEVLGRGGQMGSFEAVFSPRGADGKPARLWDRTTGKLDARVARAWKKYDIALKLKREWSSLGPRLAGKLHIFCGDRDTFFLDGAVLRLRDELKNLGSDAYVEIVPGAGHGLTPGVRLTVARQVAEQFARFQK